MWKVLVSAPYFQPVVDRFRPLFEENGVELVVPPVTERLEADELLSLVHDIDGVISGDDRFTERVLQAAPRLKVISKWGTGIDSIDREACARLGIAVCNTPNAFSEPVADSVMGYVLCFARRLPWMDSAIKSGIWEKTPSRSLRECTLGVIGVGNVGKAVARRAEGFGLRILGTDPVVPPETFIERTAIEMLSLAELLREADFVSVNCDLNPTSYHLLGARQFKAMKPSGVVINTARGSIIDEPALIDALQQEFIAGAALDVFEHEPLPYESLLRTMPNVMLAPHNSNSSPEAYERIHANTVANLLRVLHGSVPCVGSP